MRIWPRSLRGRLILTVTLTMVVTQLVLLLGASQAFGRFQRTERIEQMLRHISFIKTIVEKQTDIPHDVLMPDFGRRPHDARSGIAKLAPKDGNTAKIGNSDSSIAIDPPPIGTSPITSPLIGPPHFRPNRPNSAFMITNKPPPEQGNAELLAKMRESIPEVQQVIYEEKNEWLVAGPNPPYELTVWTKLSDIENGSGAARYLKTMVDKPADAHRPYIIFPLYELILRGGIGVLLALLITSWIVKPLAKLAEAADDTLPSGDTKSGVPLIQTKREPPAEIAHTLAAFERMRHRISSMVVERTTMLTALAHDLRTPITRLMLRLELSSDARLREDAMRDLTKMQTMIARTLDFLRSAEQGQHISKVDLRSAIDAAVASLGTDAAARVVVQDVEAQHIVQIMANRWGIERMFANVIDNALKYGEHAIVEISTDDKYATISITDYGNGVPAESLARLKEPFFRVDSSRNLDEGGAGLGLSIVDNLVRTYGGEWSIHNVTSAGNTHSENIPTGLVVKIRLPILKATS
jgi:signal transduction histidine kinase